MGRAAKSRPLLGAFGLGERGDLYLAVLGPRIMKDFTLKSKVEFIIKILFANNG